MGISLKCPTTEICAGPMYFLSEISHHVTLVLQILERDVVKFDGYSYG